jgi:hypothetical protein
MKKHLTILTILLTSFCFAQSSEETTSSNITTFKNYLVFKTNISTQNESFSVFDGDENYSIEALNAFKLQFAANYRFLGLSFAFSPVGKDSQFKSKFVETKVRFFIKKFIQSAEYRRVQGFYLENVSTDAVDQQFPHLKTTSYIGETSYVFNDDFSLKHLTDQNEWQHESAGSFIPAIRYGYNRISDYLIDGKLVQNNYDIKLAPSYYYTWCLKNNWFISPNATPTLGVRFSKETFLDTEVSDTFLTKGLNLGIQYGYTSERISTGAIFNFEANSINENTGRSLEIDRNYVNLYFTYRFDAPRFLEDAVDKVYKKLGL